MFHLARKEEIHIACYGTWHGVAVLHHMDDRRTGLCLVLDQRGILFIDSILVLLQSWPMKINSEKRKIDRY